MSGNLHTHEYQVFRAMLVQARKASGLTQVQVAKALGKPQSYISKYENGERRLDFPEFVEISEILGIDVVAFVKEFRAVTPTHRQRVRHKNRIS